MIVPGAGWASKQWQIEKFSEIAAFLEKNGCQVLLSGSGSELELLKEAASRLKHPHFLAGRLQDTVDFLPHLKVFIGNDSGVTHLAAANDIPVLAFFCSTCPECILGTRENVKVLCSSCRFKPDEKHFFCGGYPRISCTRPEFMDISTDQAIEVLKGML